MLTTKYFSKIHWSNVSYKKSVKTNKQVFRLLSFQYNANALSVNRLLIYTYIYRKKKENIVFSYSSILISIYINFMNCSSSSFNNVDGKTSSIDSDIEYIRTFFFPAVHCALSRSVGTRSFLFVRIRYQHYFIHRYNKWTSSSIANK